MLRKAERSDRTRATAGRIVALDRARTFITLLVLIHHSVVNYTHFGSGDKMRWLGFDLVVLFNDSFFMACMFLISGLFVHDSLTRRGASNFLQHRAWRLGIPFLVSIFVLMPIAYYPTFLRYHLPGTTDFSFFHFWWRTLTVGPWPSGPAWFLWVLLALDIVAAALLAVAPRMLKIFGLLIFSLRDRPWTAFVAFLAFSVVSLRADAADRRRYELAGARRLSVADPDQPDFALCRLFPDRCRHRRGQPSCGYPQRGRRIRKALAALACLCVVVLRRDPADGLCPSQLDRRFQFAAAFLANRLQPRLCAVQRSDDVHGTGRVAGLRLIEHEAARCHAAICLRHLSHALHFHHLAAIRCLRLFLAGLRQVCRRFLRHAGAELGGHVRCCGKFQLCRE